MASVVRRLRHSHVCGSIPALHVVVLGVELLGLAQLAWNYSDHFNAKPLLTSMVMNAIMNAIADTIAQTVTATRRRSVRQRVFSPKKEGGVSIEIHEKGPLGDLYASQTGFDIERLIRFMAWGFLWAPIQFKWFELLAEMFPIDEESAWPGTIWRMILDQFVMSPFGLGAFFVFITIAEGGTFRAVKRKFENIFVSTMKSNYVVWPAVQILNFRVVPLHLQLPFASCVGVCWNVFLSLKNDMTDTH